MPSINSIFLAQSQVTSSIMSGAIADTIKSVDAQSKAISIAKTFEEVWTMVMDGNLYKYVCLLGLTIAILAIGFWCVKFYIALEEGYKPTVTAMIFPIIVVILLSNGGANMRNITITARDVMNGVNESVNKVVGMDIDMRQAIQSLAVNQAAKNSILTIFESCDGKYNLNEFNACMKSRKIIADRLVKNVQEKNESVGSAAFRARMEVWGADLLQTSTAYAQFTSPQEVEKAYSTPPVPQIKVNQYPVVEPAPSPSPAASPAPGSTASPGLPANKSPDVFSNSTYTSRAGMQEINLTILGFRKAFLYIIEVMMLVSALIGPIFVALSMFPVGTKPMVAWGISFLSLGFCKVCFSLISGLSAIAFVYAGPNNIDMTVVSVVLGLLDPVLAFSNASGSGLNALSNVSQISQNFGLNTGAAYYVPGAGQPGDRSNTPNEKRSG
jgi:hypothetical protein